MVLLEVRRKPGRVPSFPSCLACIRGVNIHQLEHSPVVWRWLQLVLPRRYPVKEEKVDASLDIVVADGRGEVEHMAEGSHVHMHCLACRQDVFVESLRILPRGVDSCLSSKLQTYLSFYLSLNRAV